MSITLHTNTLSFLENLVIKKITTIYNILAYLSMDISEAEEEVTNWEKMKFLPINL